MRIPALTCVSLLAVTGRAQFVHNPYADHQNEAFPLDGVVPDVNATYQGEYQILLDAFHWQAALFDLSYKIEVVSFPFTPPIDNTDPYVRRMEMPDPASYARNPEAECLGWAWDNNINGGGEHSLMQSIVGPINDDEAGAGNYVSSGAASLVSHIFRNATLQSGCDGSRRYLPHTVLKHTIYASQNQVVLDSISWVYDNTRGRMRYYPFIVTSTTAPEYYDVIFEPKVLSDPNDHHFNATGNDSWYTQGGVPFGTPNYFPAPTNADIDMNEIVYPDNLATTAFDPDHDNNITLHPPPYSLLEAPLLNITAQAYAGYELVNDVQQPQFDDNNDPGTYVAHDYIIDKPIDLRTINPNEKIIYNPSVVVIDIDENLFPAQTLVFPSGYTFRTVHGVHPSETDVLANDPAGVYPDPAMAVASTLGTNSSIYTIKSGSTLEIEPCVTIMDARFIVEDGATLFYDPDYVDGNFTVQANVGSTVAPLMVAPPDLPCVSQCFEDGWNDVVNLDVVSNETWELGSIPSDADSDDIVRIAGTLRVKDGAVLTIDDDVRLEFGPNGRIVVERGARLYATGAIFTSACNAMWKGIEVWGTRDADQDPVIGNTVQGTFYANSCTFENARTATGAFRGDDPTPEQAFNGGVVQLSNNTFRNNQCDVRIDASVHVQNGVDESNRSSILANTFLTDDYLLDPAYNDGPGNRMAAPKHIVLSGVQRIPVNYNSFSVTPPLGGSFLPHLRGSAIEAFDASIMANGNEFDGFSQGIWHEGFSEINTGAIIRNNLFTNCLHSILCVGSNLDLVKGNTIDVPVSPQHGYDQMDPNEGYDYPVGIYMLECARFMIEENTVTGNEVDGTSAKPSYAMVVNQCALENPFDASHVYLNSISGTNVGLQCEGDNKGNGDDGGLLIECNTFGSTTSDIHNFDILVVGNWLEDDVIVDAPLRNQGLCIPFDARKQAGNNFSVLDIDVDTRDHFFFDDNALAQNGQFKYSDREQQLPVDDVNDNATNAAILNDCAGGLTRSCGASGLGHKPSLVVKSLTLDSAIASVDTQLGIATLPNVIDSLQRLKADHKGHRSVVQNALVQYALEFEELDSAYQYLNNGEGLGLLRPLAWYYAAKGLLPHLDSVLALIIDLENGLPSAHTQMLQLKRDLVGHELRFDETQLALLEDLIAGTPHGAMTSRAVLRQLQGRPYFRVPWKMNDDIPGYRGSNQEQTWASGTSSIWPNPTNGVVHLLKPSVDIAPIVQVFSPDGRRVPAIVENRTEVVRLDLSGLSTGTYFIRMLYPDHTDAHQVLLLSPVAR